MAFTARIASGTTAPQLGEQLLLTGGKVGRKDDPNLCKEIPLPAVLAWHAHSPETEGAPILSLRRNWDGAGSSWCRNLHFAAKQGIPNGDIDLKVQVIIAPFEHQYFSTTAPVIVGNHVLVGTGNDLAHVAGTGTVAAALQAAARGVTHAFDAIEVTCVVDGRNVVTHACCFAAVGLAADVVRLTTPAVKRIFGPRLCYSVGFFRALRRHVPVTARINADGRVHEGDHLLICAGKIGRAHV